MEQLIHFFTDFYSAISTLLLWFIVVCFIITLLFVENLAVVHIVLFAILAYLVIRVLLVDIDALDKLIDLTTNLYVENLVKIIGYLIKFIFYELFFWIIIFGNFYNSRKN